MSIAAPEQAFAPIAPESIPTEAFERAVNLGLNYTPKMLLLLLMHQRPDFWFSAADMLNGINGAQGSYIGWEREGGDSFNAFCLASLEPAGYVEAGSKKGALGEEVMAFRITGEGSEIGVPFFGAVLDLELRTEFSSHALFGYTNSSAANRDTYRSPLMRLQIVQHILDSAGQSTSLSGIRRAIPRSIGSVDSAVDNLADGGVLRILNKINPAHRTLALSRPDQERIDRYISSMSPANAALHRTLVRLYRQDTRNITGDALIREVMRRHPVTQDAVWKAVNDSRPHCLNFSDEALYGSNKGRSAPRSRIEIAPQYVTAITDLLRSLEAVRHSGTYREMATAQAERIITNEAAVAYLMAKARMTSRFVHNSGKEAAERAELLKQRTIGWVSLKDTLTLQGVWQARAACLDTNPDAFFAPDEEAIEPDELERLRKLCNGCAVRLQCIKWAVEKPEEHGFWGGYSEEERKNLPANIESILGVLTVSGV